MKKLNALIVTVAACMLLQPRLRAQPQPPAAKLTCTQAMQTCFATNDAARCVAERASPSAQWWISAISQCAAVQNCKVAWCVEQGCPTVMAKCRADTPDSPLPYTFEGEWSYGSVSTVGFYSPSTGWNPGSSTGSSYNFKKDGTYEYAIMMQSRTYTCGAGAFAWTTGRYQVQGNQLTLVEKVSKLSTADSCSNKRAAQDVKPGTQTFQVVISPSDFTGEPRLTLYKDGKPYSQPYSHR